jgi:hypothetical protein
MPVDYLHNHPQFADLIRIVAAEKSIDSALVEKDYWIVHALYGLQQLGLKFELKGGTSLSNGHKIIDRFSEDIDIRIEPPAELDVKIGRNHDKPAHIESRKRFYDWLAKTIRFDGITKVERDAAFDDAKLRNGVIGTQAYTAHKERRFREGDNLDIAENQAFILADPATRAAYAKAFAASTALYYGTKPTFEQVLAKIGTWIERM